MPNPPPEPPPEPPAEPMHEPPVPPLPEAPDFSYASRGALKLEAAFKHWNLDASGLVAADLGCSTGGFTDVLLRRGAARVHSVDTAYGEFDYRLRTDPRVVLHERSNALHLPPAEPVDLVVIDLGWTKQDRALPSAAAWLARDGAGAYAGAIVTLIKPQYEAQRPKIELAMADLVAREVAASVPGLVPGLRCTGLIRSPIRGGKGKNPEHLAWLRPAS